MESALVRPRLSPAPPRAGRAIRITLCLVGTVLAASSVVLQPFAASHLFPARRVSAPKPPARVPPGEVKPISGDLPTAAEPASEPPHPSPADAATASAEEPRVAAPSSIPASQSPAPPAIAVAPTPAAEPAPQAVAPPIRPAAARDDSPPVPAPALTAPAAPASEPAAAQVGPPPPREPLPLETDLIGLGSPLGSPVKSPRGSPLDQTGRGPIARPDPTPDAGVVPATKKLAAGRHG